MRDNGLGEIEELSKFFGLAHVFKGALIILGGEEIIALFEPQPFADVFEAVGVGPADADGFFGEGEGLFMLGMDGVFGLNPVDLVRHEVLGQSGIGIDFDGGEDGGHGRGVGLGERESVRA